MTNRAMRLGAVLFLAVLGGCASADLGRPEGLRCEYLTDPAALGERVPRFSWEVSDTRRGAKQTAYELRVRERSMDGATVWASGKVESSRNVNVEYGGPALRAGGRYAWSVRTWDGEGAPSDWSEPASFAIGLLEPADWGGAAWI